MSNPNENCLAGFKCPECGSYGPFIIALTMNVRVYDNGTDDPAGDIEWDNDSDCQCDECGYGDRVAEFKEDPEADA